MGKPWPAMALYGHDLSTSPVQIILPNYWYSDTRFFTTIFNVRHIRNSLRNQPTSYSMLPSFQQMRFTQLIAAQGEYVSMSYGVYINDRNLNHERKVSSCEHVHRGTAKDDSSKVYPCSTWQVRVKNSISSH